MQTDLYRRLGPLAGLQGNDIFRVGFAPWQGHCEMALLLSIMCSQADSEGVVTAVDHGQR